MTTEATTADAATATAVAPLVVATAAVAYAAVASAVVIVDNTVNGKKRKDQVAIDTAVAKGEALVPNLAGIMAKYKEACIAIGRCEFALAREAAAADACVGSDK